MNPAPNDLINPATLKALREYYLLCRRNGMSIAKASALLAQKARALNATNVRKYVQIIVEQLEENESC